MTKGDETQARADIQVFFHKNIDPLHLQAVVTLEGQKQPIGTVYCYFSPRIPGEVVFGALKMMLHHIDKELHNVIIPAGVS